MTSQTSILLLFIGSGAAALIYEVVWFQLLQLLIGSSAVSLSVLLGTFMGGMCLGSLGLPRFVSKRHHPLRVYAFLELGLGITGMLVLLITPYVGGLYVAVGGYGPWGVLARALVSAVCLVPPTLLMGATLPAIARWVESTPRGVSWLGFFYGGNIVGAVTGCLIAGFYLLRLYDMHTATHVAAAINLSAALIAFLLSRRTPAQSSFSERTVAVVPTPASRPAPVYVVIALSGIAALGAEVVWTRVLSLLLGPSVYTFSIILAVYLSGLGVGSGAASILSARIHNPRWALGVCQLLLVATISWTAYVLSQVLPYWPIDPTLSRSPWLTFQLDLLCAALAVLPSACLWGASFPLALAAVVSEGQDPGRLVGRVYAVNTLGAVTGAIVFSLIVTHSLGTQQAERLLIVISGVAAMMMMMRLEVHSRSRNAIWTGGAVLVVLAAAWSITPVPSSVIAYGRFTARALSQRDPITRELFVPNIIYASEGLNASIAVSQTPAGHRSFHVSGKIEASTEPPDMRLQRMLGHLPALLHPEPRSILVVGFGAGVTAGSFVLHPGVERIIICEIERKIPEVVSRYFAEQNNHVLEDPRVEVIYDDARHYLLTTEEKFDVITSDPIHPWVKGAATLYTREYLELVRRRLNAGGVVTQWVPLYQTSMEAVKSELATFFEVFPDGTVWSNDVGGRGYDIVLLSHDSPGPIHADELDQRLNRTDHGRVTRSLNTVGFESSVKLLATYAGRASDLVSWLAGAEINRDRNLRLQYLAGLSMSRDEGAYIHEAIIRHRRFPQELFLGSSGRLEELRSAIEGRRPRMLQPAQAAAISKALAGGPPRRVSIRAVMGNPEAFQYATQLRQAIVDGGWQVDGVNQSVFSDLIVGMVISVGQDPPPPAANELFRALRAAGLAASGSLDGNAHPDRVSLFVGENQ